MTLLQIVVEEKPPSMTMFWPVTKDEARDGGQPDDRAGQLLRPPEAGHRRVPDDLLAPRGVGAVGVHQQGAVLLGGEEAGAEGVDPHPARCPLAGQELRQVQHGGLGRRVGDDARERRHPRQGGDVDDAPPARFQHRPAEDLARQQDAADQVEVEHVPPGGQRQG